MDNAVGFTLINSLKAKSSLSMVLQTDYRVLSPPKVTRPIAILILGVLLYCSSPAGAANAQDYNEKRYETLKRQLSDPEKSKIETLSEMGRMANFVKGGMSQEECLKKMLKQAESQKKISKKESFYLASYIKFVVQNLKQKKEYKKADEYLVRAIAVTEKSVNSDKLIATGGLTSLLSIRHQLLYGMGNFSGAKEVQKKLVKIQAQELK